MIHDQQNVDLGLSATSLSAPVFDVFQDNPITGFEDQEGKPKLKRKISVGKVNPLTFNSFSMQMPTTTIVLFSSYLLKYEIGELWIPLSIYFITYRITQHI